LDTCQFEAGKPTSYAPYFTPIELCKLGAYQDYIYKDGSDWKIHKSVGKAVFDGSEAWFRSGSTSATNFVVALRIDNAKPYILTPISSVDYAVMNAFANLPDVASLRTTQGFRLFNGSTKAQNIGLSFDINEVEDLEAAITWITDNTPVIYYPLSTATDTTIADSNLIAQLEALVKGGSEEGTTYIKVSATDPNLPGLSYVEAPKYE
jgi:hypothetical protein